MLLDDEAGASGSRARGLEDGELAGEGLEPGPGGDVLVVGEEDGLRGAGGAAQQLEQRRLHVRREPGERVVEDEREALLVRRRGCGPATSRATSAWARSAAWSVPSSTVPDESWPRLWMSSRSRAAAVISSWCSSAQSTLTSPTISAPAGGGHPVVLGRGEQAAAVSWLDSRPLTRWSWKPR